MTCTNPDRIYAQYRTKPKAVQWYKITETMGNELCDASDMVSVSYDIDSSSGAQLDVIGRIVVLDRSYESEVVFDTHDWGESTSQFGGQNIQFSSPSVAGSSEASDEIYRLLLKAKISKNNSDATLDGIVDALNFIIDSPNTRVIDNEDMTFSVSFGSELTTTQRFVLDTFPIVPKPQGVRFLGYVEESAITQFGGLYNWGDSRAQFGQFFGV
jgi:hypothetical protein